MTGPLPDEPVTRLGRPAHEARSSAREELARVTESLIAEFSGTLPAGTVLTHVARSREQLLSAGVRAGLAAAVEAMARVRLLALVPAHRLEMS